MNPPVPLNEPYTPTTDEVRKHLRSASHLVGRVPAQDVAMFDRWLAAHDREVAAKALRDAADEAQIRLGGEVSGHTSTYSVRQWLHRRADRIERGEG